MGSTKFRARSLPFEEEDEDHSETTKTCCWTGIRKVFSKSKRPKSMALQVMEDDMNSDDDSDDVIHVNDSSKSSATSTHSATGIELRALQTSWSAPVVLGHECHQSLMHSSRKAEDELPSTSYPKDVTVSSQYFLFYHRFINDEENDDESVTSDVEFGDEDGDNADVESNADDDKAPVPGLVYSEDEYTDNDCSVDQEADREREIKDAIEESSEDETSSQTDQTMMVKKCDIVQITKVKSMDQTEEDSSSYLSSGPSGDDVTSDDETTSQVGEVCVDEIETMFLISLIWTFIRNPLYGIYQAGLQLVQDIVMGKEDEIDVDEERAVVVRGETRYRTPQGHPERYPDFTFNTFWAYIRNAWDSVYQTGLQFVHNIMVEEDEGEMDVDERCTVVGTEEAGDRTPLRLP